MDISCAFPPSLATPGHVAHAEQLGYRRAWLYDSPALYPDVWMVLGLAAERTSRIGLGTAVLVPSLRHPMVNAAAIATLAEQAPGRVAIAIGSGFTGRMVLGQRPMRWRDVAAYVSVLEALLHGETVEWEGRALRMLHPAGFGAPRPVDVPILIAADGPKGMAVAAELGDGIFFGGVPKPDAPCDWRALLTWGTVLEEGEDAASPRVAAAAGAGVVVAYHAMWEWGGPDVVDSLPGGSTWRAAIEAHPTAERHLAVHEGHLVEPNERDRLVLDEAMTMVTGAGMTGTAAQIRERIAGLAEAGVTEIAYQPQGPDIRRELEAFAAAAS